MKHILALLTIQFNMWIKQLNLGVTVIVAPLLLFSAIGLVVSHQLTPSEAVEKMAVGVVDLDQTFETKQAIGQMFDNEEVEQVIEAIDTTEEQGQDMLSGGTLDALVIIPEGFSEDLRQGVNSPITVIGQSSQPLQSALIRQLLTAATHYVSAAQSGVNAVHYFLVEQDVAVDVRQGELQRNIVTFSLDALGRLDVFEEVQVSGLFQENIVMYYVGSFLVLAIMTWSFFIVLLLRQAFDTATFDRLRTRGMDDWHFAGSTLLGASVIVAGVGLSVGLPAVYLADGHASLFLLAVGIALLALLFSSFFYGISLWIRSEQGVQIISWMFILIGAILGGHFVPTLYFPDWLRSLSEWTINLWTLGATIDLLQGATNGLSTLGIFVMGSLIFVAFGILVQKGAR
ncbi:ABC transporter permease [Alkalihalophilus sp. As8PL]|uniref:ABC transporter permease n=1 Tax=Alkalihalophilus sp. As8PL TaxID=3237103 RepID=A0AB39BPQ3_9BACI